MYRGKQKLKEDFIGFGSILVWQITASVFIQWPEYSSTVSDEGKIPFQRSYQYDEQDMCFTDVKYIGARCHWLISKKPRLILLSEHVSLISI